MILQALHYAKLLLIGVCFACLVGFICAILGMIVFITLIISGIAVLYSLIAADPSVRQRPRKKAKRLISVDGSRSAD